MTNHIAGIARSAMLVDLNISTYSGRKQDRATQKEVTLSKGSGSSKAASVYKNLFAECKELDEIIKFQARARGEHYRLTLPWDDRGARLLPTAQLLNYKALMNRCQSEFQLLVDAFLDKYDTLVAAAAFQLGTLFDRNVTRWLAGSAWRLRLCPCLPRVTSEWRWRAQCSASWPSSTSARWSSSWQQRLKTRGTVCTKH